jgi:hypothetical protein
VIFHDCRTRFIDELAFPHLRMVGAMPVVVMSRRQGWRRQCQRQQGG